MSFKRFRSTPREIVISACKLWVVTNYTRNFFIGSIRPHFRKPGGGLFGWIVRRIFRSKLRQDLIREAVVHCDIQPNDSVLELGFGPGFGLKFAAECVKSGTGKVYGTDFSPVMVEEATKLIQEENLQEKVEVRLGDVHELPYEDESIDIIFHLNCYYFWDDRQKAITGIHRVLKDGGKMVTVFNKDRLTTAVEKGMLTKEQTDWEKYMSELKLYNFNDVKMEEFKDPHSNQNCSVILAFKGNQK